jgi:nucleotidyltransferase AbiEii toxin of type IV toxin-antitoxin system
VSSQSQSDWARLLRIAYALIHQVNEKQNIIDSWTFGGSTAMMLQIEHRESHDVDIFLPDPQLLPFLDPQTHDFQFKIKPDACVGDGARSLKLVFNVGEIDFIVASSLTRNPTRAATVEGIDLQLETIPEIVTKKIYHRGASIKPRDIFDIAAGGRHHADSIIIALRDYREHVQQALATIRKLNPEFVNRTIAQLAIKEAYRGLAENALSKTVELLDTV